MLNQRYNLPIIGNEAHSDDVPRSLGGIGAVRAESPLSLVDPFLFRYILQTAIGA